MTAVTAFEVSRTSTYWLWWRVDQGEGYLPGDWILIPLVSMQFRGSSLLARYIFGNTVIADSLCDDADALESLNSPE